MSDPSPYLLGHAPEELERLGAQHEVWRSTLLDALPIDPGEAVLEVGCGGGHLLADLAARSAHTLGLERDPIAARHARQLAGVEVLEGDLYDTPLPDGLDWIVARWVLSFVPNLDGAVARLAGQLGPGGRLVVQDYNHEGLSLFPHEPAVTRVFEAFRSAYSARGGDLWVAGRLPASFERAGLTVESITPHAKAGGPESGVFRWVERFLHGHVDTLVDDGELTAIERDAFLSAWRRARAARGATLFSPLVVTVVGVLPDRRG